MIDRRLLTTLTLLTPLAAAVAAHAQHGSLTIMGLPDLVARLGTDTPDGTGVVVAEIEALSSGAYGPNQANADFTGKSFYEMSGPAGVSSHATTVGKFLFGNAWSLARGVNEIYLFEAGHWLQAGYLRTTSGSSVPPLPPPAGVRIMNNSWIASFNNASLDNIALRRADFVVTRDSMLLTNGVNNGGASQPLLSHMFNAICVGVRGGTHTWVDTAAAYDGPGRMKPEIVAPDDFSSFATPMAGAAYALLLETVDSWAGLLGNPVAGRTEVLKAVLLAGARHENLFTGTWTNNPATSGPQRGITARPIDERVGVGTVNIDRSHRILTGLQQPGLPTPPALPHIGHAGWHLAAIPKDESHWWRFRLTKTAGEISIVATWHRFVRDNFTFWSLANIDLHLWKVDSKGQLEPLTGDDGVGIFAGGNVASVSTVDNVEHLYITGLEPGEYLLEARRIDAVTTPNGPWSVAVAWLMPETSFTVSEDLDGDGAVGFSDLLILLAAWGPCGTPCPADLDGDGTIGFSDLLLLLSAWSQ